MTIQSCLSYVFPCCCSAPEAEQAAVIPQAPAIMPAQQAAVIPLAPAITPAQQAAPTISQAPPQAPRAQIRSVTLADLSAIDDISDLLSVTLAEVAGVASQAKPSTKSFYAPRTLPAIKEEEEELTLEELELPGFSDPKYVSPRFLESKLNGKMAQDERKEQPKAAAIGAGAVSPLATISDKPLSILLMLASPAAQSKQ